MVKISYLGHSSFKIKSSEVIVITDPFDPKATGLKWKKVRADIVTVSHQHSDHNYLTGIEGQPFLISEPGEYEVKGVHVIGLASFHDGKRGKDRGENIAYMIHLDDFSIVHLGDLGAPLSSGQLENLNTVDVLLVPVGGKYTMNVEAVSELIAQIEPSYIVPMHYHLPGSKLGLDPLDKFLEQMGVESPVTQADLDLRSRVALPEETTVVVLDKK